MWPRVTTVCLSGTGLDIQTGLWIRLFSVQSEDGPELKPRHRAHPKAGLLKIPAWSPVPCSGPWMFLQPQLCHMRPTHSSQGRSEWGGGGWVDRGYRARVQESWVQFPALLQTSCVILGSLHLSFPAGKSSFILFLPPRVYFDCELLRAGTVPSCLYSAWHTGACRCCSATCAGNQEFCISTEVAVTFC